jgi:hypothetical protein
MGPIAQVGADHSSLTRVGSSAYYYGGDIIPFDLSFGLLVIGAVLVLMLWSEKYKEVESQSGETRQCSPTAWIPSEAVTWMCTHPIAVTLMCGSACTEAAMYSFVIEWTPALTSPKSRPPLGLVFSSFMLAYMAGSTLLGWVTSPTADSALLIATSAIGAIAMGVAALLSGVYPSGVTCTTLPCHVASPPVEATYMIFVAMCIFEACLGAYFVLVGSVKAKQVPENLRAAVYGVFRVPLNIMVVAIQLLSPSTPVSLLVSALLLVVAVLCFSIAHNSIKKPNGIFKSEAPSESSPLNSAKTEAVCTSSTFTDTYEAVRED